MVIGEGLGPRVVKALLTVLAEDARFRDLPIGVLDNAAVDDERLPNLVRVASDPARLVERILPFVRLQAFESQLKRVLKSLETEGVVDPDTGLLVAAAFWRDLERAVQEARSLAKRSRLRVSRSRASPTAAPISMPRGCSAGWCATSISPVGNRTDRILAAFTGTDLRSAHVIARRIASVLKQTMLSPGRERRTIRPTITLAALKPTDNLSTLVARVGANSQVAAE